MADHHSDVASATRHAIAAAIEAVRPLIAFGLESLVRACAEIDRLIGRVLGAEARRQIAEIVYEVLTSPGPGGGPGRGSSPGLHLAGGDTPR